jgi:hypothetical protein
MSYFFNKKDTIKAAGDASIIQLRLATRAGRTLALSDVIVTDEEWIIGPPES